MTRPTVTVGLIAALVLVIAGEFLASEMRVAALNAPEARPAQAQDHAVAAAEVAASPADIDNWLRVALARPLMSSTRQAAPQAGSGANLNGGLPRLSGTLVAADGRIAIFARDDAGHAVIAHEGGLLGPYRVSRISPNSVTLEGPSGVQTLHPSFGAKQSGDADGDADAANPPFAMPGVAPPMPGPAQPFRLQMPTQPSGQ